MWRKSESSRWLHQIIKENGRTDLGMTFRKILTLQSVLHIPTLRSNLISKSSLLRAGYVIVNESNKFIISKSNIFIAKGFVSDCIFRLNVINSSDNENSIHVALNVESCDIWHERLGHVNFNSIKKMINLNLIPISSFRSTFRCEICVQGKHTRKSFFYHKTSEPLEFIYSDVCDSNRVLTLGGRRYFVTFIDDYSKFCYTYLLKFKDEVLGWSKMYIAKAENHLKGRSRS